MNGCKQPPNQALFFAGEASEEKSRTVDYIKMFNFCGFSLWVFPMTSNLSQTVALCKINCCFD